ncbi:MAG: peptidoglycan D,D-transpeptidase FtsI family protein, partial [Candidatus Zixiibacteriota bacterium]
NEYGDPQGYFGIEGYFDGDLKGKPGRIIEEQDALGAPILAGGYKKVDSTDGSSIVLTINRAVQYLVESRLSESVEKYGAKSGSVIVMDPFSGDVIAMANYPTYDPANFNDFGGGASEVDALGKTNDESDSTNNLLKKVERTNLAISQTYEPGSVIKGLTVSSAVDLGIVSPDTTFVDAGPVQYSDYVIDNWDSVHHGVQTIVQLLQKSNNIGAAWVGHKVGAKNLSKYFKSFGLGEKTNIDLEGEDTGIIRDYSTWTDIDIATVAFGQGISATPLQVLNGFNAIANGGRVMRPRIVKTIVDGDKVIEMPVTFEREVISKKTSDTMIDMLTKAVSGGESRYFNIKNYNIAGKTGTAQIPEKGTYNPNKTNATFVGFLSTSKRFSIIVKLEEPQSSIYAAETAAPLFMRITEDLVKYYGIPPDKDPTI